MSEISLLVSVARAYYEQNQTQQEIARRLGISRSQVSRYLTEARKRGVIQIRIMLPDEEASALAATFKPRYPHLRDVVVAPAFDNHNGVVRSVIGRAAADYLAQVIRPGQIVALGCGRTLREVVNALRKQPTLDVSVVQAMGNVGHDAHNVDYNEVARAAADALGARVYYVSAPAILGQGSGPARSFIQANPALGEALDLARHADIYMVGLGSLRSDQLYARAGLIRQGELDAIADIAVGDICGRFFDLQGREHTVAFSERIVGVELANLQNAALSIGVAGGGDKVAPLLGAIRGKLINVVITDEHTARSLLRLDDETYSPGLTDESHMD
jgi:deoxyribonucleoside regulator